MLARRIRTSSTICSGLLIQLGLILPALIGSCAAPPLPESTTDVSTASAEPDWTIFVLGPNDVVSVRVVGRPEYADLAGGLRVSPAGNLAIPRIAPVAVTGLSVEEAAAVIEEALGVVLQRPEVSVSLLELASRQFHALGMVGRPGPSAFDRPTTALEAVALAGGLREGARAERAALIRPHGDDAVEVIAFNAETPDPGGLVQVRPGDVLFVPRTGTARYQETLEPYLRTIGLGVGQLSTALIALDRIQAN